MSPTFRHIIYIAAETKRKVVYIDSNMIVVYYCPSVRPHIVHFKIYEFFLRILVGTIFVIMRDENVVSSCYLFLSYEL